MAYDALDDILKNRKLSPEQQSILIERRENFNSKEELNSYIESNFKQNENSEQEDTPQQEETQNVENTDATQHSTSTSRPAGEGNGQDATASVGGTEINNPKGPTSSVPEVKSEQDIEREKLAQARATLEGMDTDRRNLNPKEVANDLASEKKGGHSIKDLAQMQLVVREAEFKEKYNLPLTEDDKKILANKDKLSDEILAKMEGYAAGTQKITDYTRTTKMAEMTDVKYAMDDKGKTLKDDEGKPIIISEQKKQVEVLDVNATAKKEKENRESFNILLENAPETLKQHCGKTLEKANARVNNVRANAKKMKRDEKLGKRAAKIKNLEDKLESLKIEENDKKLTKLSKTFKQIAPNMSLKITRGIINRRRKLRKAWRKSLFGKALNNVIDNRYRRGFRQWRMSAKNYMSLVPSRFSRFLGKQWNKFKQSKVGKFLKRGKDAVVGAAQWVGGLPKRAYKGTKSFVNARIEWCRQHPKTAIALGAAVIAVGYVSANPAIAMAGSKVAGIGIAAAVTGMGATALAVGGYQAGVNIKNWTVEKFNNGMNKIDQKLYEADQQRAEKRKEAKPRYDQKDIDYMQGRQIFNEHPEEIQKLIDDYKKSINPEGNEGKPKDEKESAVQLMQMLTSKDKTKGGLGLEPEQVNNLVAYLNQSQLKDGQKTLPTYEEMQKASESSKEQPTRETENKGKVAEVIPPIKKKEKIAEDVLISQLDAEQKTKYLQAKSEYDAMVKRNFGNDKEEQKAASIFKAKLFGKYKGKDQDGNPVDKNIGIDNETANAFVETLGRTGRVRSFKQKQAQEQNHSNKGLDAQKLKSQKEAIEGR